MAEEPKFALPAPTPEATVSEPSALAAPTPRLSSRAMPKWELEAKERLRAAIRRLSKPLAGLITNNATEADTGNFVCDFLCQAFGFNKFSEVTAEYRIKEKFADYALKIDKKLVAFVEVKKASKKLADKHLDQLEAYAAKQGLKWAILTNGAEWQVYHLRRRLPLSTDLVFAVNLLGDGSPRQKADQLFYLTRESLKRGQLDDLWKKTQATSAPALASAILSKDVVATIRKELRRKTKQKIEVRDIVRSLKENVFRPECLKK